MNLYIKVILYISICMLALGGCRKKMPPLTTPVDIEEASKDICPTHVAEIDRFLEHGSRLIWIRFDVDQLTSGRIQEEIIKKCGLIRSNSSAWTAKNHAESITSYSDMTLAEWIPDGFSLQSGFTDGNRSLAIYAPKTDGEDRVVLVFSSSNEGLRR